MQSGHGGEEVVERTGESRRERMRVSCIQTDASLSPTGRVEEEELRGGVRGECPRKYRSGDRRSKGKRTKSLIVLWLEEVAEANGVEIERREGDPLCSSVDK